MPPVKMPETRQSNLSPAPPVRRHDVDWLRTMALGLLIIYHSVVSFQPWASQILFIQNNESLEWLWIFMAMINVWRIPILFVVSGMGARFAMERRDWKQLLADRSLRILLPYGFGIFTVVPLFIYFALKFFGKPPAYIPHPGHLWFLGNIFAYVLILLPVMVYLKNRPGHWVWTHLGGLCEKPWGLYLASLAIMLEAWLVHPQYFAAYANSVHGFCLGLVCFALGFIFASLKDQFWAAVARARHGAIALAFTLYLVRLFAFKIFAVPKPLVGFECTCWLLVVLGYASLYLNKPSAALAYLSRAVYPVYIIHLPIQIIISYYLIPLDIPPLVKLVVLVAGVFATSLVVYHYGISRVKWLRPLFGMKLNQAPPPPLKAVAGQKESA
jgi:glucan biosynthesis protein C